MQIIDVKTQNINLLNQLTEMEKESKGMINGRQMIVSRACVTVYFMANLSELCSINEISDKLTVKLEYSEHKEDYAEAFKMYSQDDYSKFIDNVFDKKDVMKPIHFPIGITEFYGSCTFIGTNIRILTNTGNFSELFENKDSSFEDKIPELFYKAVYRNIMSELDYDYSFADKFLNMNLYNGLPKKRFTVMRIFVKNGITSVPFIWAKDEDVAKGMKLLKEECDDIINIYGGSILTAEISCHTSLYTYYALRLFSDKTTPISIIDQRPMNEFLFNKHEYSVKTEWNDIYQKLEDTRNLQSIQRLGLIPADTYINYTLNVDISGTYISNFYSMTKNEEVKEFINLLESIKEVCK